MNRGAARSPGPGTGTWNPGRVLAGATGGLVLLGLLALLAPWISPYDPSVPLGLESLRLVPPGLEHPLGTDRLSRDVLSRVLHGGRVSLLVGVFGAVVALVLGVAVGLVSGFFGGWVDRVSMAVVDVFLAFPRLVLLIVVAALFRPSPWVLVGVLGFTLWPPIARLVRAEVLSVRDRGYVHAAEALGLGRIRILLRHVLPNVIAPVVVAGTLVVGDAVVLEAGLSFLGLGMPAGVPSWGAMIYEGLADPVDSWWVSVFPGIAIVATVLCVNLLGEGLRARIGPEGAG